MHKELQFKTKDNIILKITIELRKKDNCCKNFKNLRNIKSCYECSITGEARKGTGVHNWLYAGACVSHFSEFLGRLSAEDSKKVSNIIKIEKRYHLNDLHAGTQRQEDALHAAKMENWANDYTKCCDYLKSINLFEDRGYKFGHGWLCEIVPAKVVRYLEGL
jgi:hypothetical protein